MSNRKIFLDDIAQPNELTIAGSGVNAGGIVLAVGGTEIATVTITVRKGIVFVHAEVETTTGAASEIVTIVIQRDGVTVETRDVVMVATADESIAISYLDTAPGSGARTYSIRGSSPSGLGSVSANRSRITAINLKV